MMIHCIVRRPLCKLNISCTSTTAESRAKIWYQLNAFKPPPPPPPPLVAWAAVRSKAVVLLLLTFCLLLLPLCESVIVLCFVVRYFMSILVLQLTCWGRESWLPLLNLSSLCLVMVEWLFLALPWGCLRL